ncbi:MAG TPA: transcription termination/antitermination protein NusG [Gemmataceae bacterium]|nr:transcription termination/antitermination protein NusG [Gemmataceae bacterium]
MMTDEMPTAADNPAPPAGEEEQKASAPAGSEGPAQAAHSEEPAVPPREPAHAVEARAGSATAENVAAENAPAENAVAEAPPPPAEAAATPEGPSNKHWYVVKVQSGREESIKEAIERKVKIEGLEEFFGQIFIPTEKVTEMRKNKRYTRERKVLPGYIMAEVEYNDRILYLFRETSGVGDFVGAQPHSNRPPPPMSEREVQKWLGKKPEADSPDAPIKHDFEKGDRVKVKEGMFKEMEGEIKEIIEAKNQVKVELTIFGRPVAVEMEYWTVERV